MVFDFVRRLFKKKEPIHDESITESLTHSETESINQSQINQSIIQEREKDVRFQKDALELGVAAGYAGRSLRAIETSVERVESLMVTKEWMSSKIEEIEENEQKRFESLVSILDSLHSVSEASPDDLKPKIAKITQKLEDHGKLAPRMQKLIDAVKETGEISYEDLAKRLGITQDGLRGLVSLVSRRSNEIQKFEKDGRKKWIKYTENPFGQPANQPETAQNNIIKPNQSDESVNHSENQS